MDKISIIIPIYNAELYIKRCIDSVIGQTYKNLEILLIDDGSTDNSGKICDEYAGKDERIRVFHKRNEGVSTALNVGLMNFTGKYIGFVDSDDWVEPDMFKELHNAIKKHNATFSVVNFYNDSDTVSTAAVNFKKIPKKVLNQLELLTYSADMQNYIGFAHARWNKLYSADFIKKNNLTFNSNFKTAEDMMFSYDLMLADDCCSAVYNDKPLYHYYQRKDSKSKTFTLDLNMVRLDACKICIGKLEKHDDISKYLKRFHCYTASKYAEEALIASDKEGFEAMRCEMKIYLNEYVELNKDFPERIERINNLLKQNFLPKNELELINRIKNAENIIVYGDREKAAAVAGCLIENGLRNKTHIAVTNLKNSNRTLRCFRVQAIHSIQHIAKKSVVVIALNDKFHTEVEKLLRNIGFQNIVTVNDTLVDDLYLRYDIRVEERNQRKLEALHCKTMNMVKLNHVRNKVSRGQKIKVLFILTSIARFNFASVYRALESKEMFEVAIFFFNAESEELLSQEEVAKYAEYLKNNGYKILFELIKDNWIAMIDKYSPDIVIYNNPYISNGRMGLSIYNILTDRLGCYIPYFLSTMNELELQFENRTLFSAWKHFIESRPVYDLCVNNALDSGINAVLSGHPVFDEYEKEINTKLFEKILNGNKTVIYAPHWMIGRHSNFHLYFDYFIGLLEKYPNINFVFKPHPVLRFEVQLRKLVKGMSSLSDYDEYCKKWNNAPNGLIVNDSSYIDLFKISDCLITDKYSSFIMAWLPTEKPCILPMNPDATSDYLICYHDHIYPVLDSYYTARTEREIESVLNNVVINGYDTKASERKKEKERLIYNFGCAGQFIADHIERELLN